MNFKQKHDILPQFSMITLPTEILESIAILAKNPVVTDTLKNHISSYVFNKINTDTDILVYGAIQGGKTKSIIKILKNTCYKNELKVLVIQSSLMVLEQYISRLTSENLKFQVINSTTTEITEKIVIVLNNKFRYNSFLKNNGNSKRYILLLDESDLTIKNCPLRGYQNFHITATPYVSQRKIASNQIYQKIIKLKEHQNYYNINKINVRHEPDISAMINFFSKPTGMMLINRYSYIEDMELCAKQLAKEYPNVPIILLNSEKKLYLDSKITRIISGSINQIIDSFHEHRHIIFIANRLANRGLSYTSSDYSRHLTFQISKVKSSKNTFIQSLRILGIYTDSPELYLYVDNLYKFEQVRSMVNEFDASELLEKLEI